jgi:hypothetical protein
MSKIINLPSGATATLRDPKTLKHKDRVKVYSGVDVNNVTAEMSYTITTNLIALLVEEWTLELLPPHVKIDSIGELEIGDYDALAVEANEALPVLFPALASTPANEADPKAPTESSND